MVTRNGKMDLNYNKFTAKSIHLFRTYKEEDTERDGIRTTAVLCVLIPKIFTIRHLLIAAYLLELPYDSQLSHPCCTLNSPHTSFVFTILSRVFHSFSLSKDYLLVRVSVYAIANAVLNISLTLSEECILHT
jgi:hypothetical protein